MPTLQVRDLPEDIYRKLTVLAQKEHRSLAQQTIAVLQEGLGQRRSNRERRKAIIAGIKTKTDSTKKIAELDPVTLIREDRER